MHPLHHYAVIGPKMKKVKDIRAATTAQYNEINENYPNKFSMFAKLCSYHRKNLAETNDTENDFIDEDYHCPIPSAESSYTKDDINEFLDSSTTISPLKFQINNTSMNDLSKTAKRYHKRKYNGALESFKFEYSKRVAPGQVTEFLEQCENTNPSIPDFTQSEITLLHDAFSSAERDSQRIIILSALPPEKYSKVKVMDMFKCHKYMVDQARKWRREAGALIQKENVQFFFCFFVFFIITQIYIKAEKDRTRLLVSHVGRTQH